MKYKIAIQIFGVLFLQAGLQAGCTQRNIMSDEPATTYPQTRRVEVFDNYDGTKISDPYRWLENDAQKDKDVADWIAAQRGASATYLGTLPGRDAFRKSLVMANNYDRISSPQKEGGRYFYTRKNGKRDLAALYVREGTSGRERVLVDPARWSEDGSVALTEWRASTDGKRLAYAVQDGGSDWRSIKVLDVASASHLRTK